MSYDVGTRFSSQVSSVIDRTVIDHYDMNDLYPVDSPWDAPDDVGNRGSFVVCRNPN